jgi:hypothetical protein
VAYTVQQPVEIRTGLGVLPPGLALTYASCKPLNLPRILA